MLGLLGNGARVKVFAAVIEINLSFILSDGAHYTGYFSFGVMGLTLDGAWAGPFLMLYMHFIGYPLYMIV